MPLPPQTSEPLEYVTDVLDDMARHAPERRIIDDPEAAATIIDAEIRSRLTAVFDRFGGTPAILLSGGVDSIYAAAVAVDLGHRPHALTVVTDGGTDRDNAAAAAGALGIPHEVIHLTPGEVARLAEDVMERIGIAELWEVTAGIPLLAARSSLEKIPGLGAVLSGNGADAILAGGKRLAHPLDSAEACAQLDALIRAESVANFRYHRLVPHFYPALLGGTAAQLVQVFQTVRWWQIAEQFAPPALFGDHDGRAVDKFALRLACERRLPRSVGHLAWAAKSPIQRSSGLVGALARAARHWAAGQHGARTYTDPVSDDPETLAARLYLAILDRHGGRAIEPGPAIGTR
ncbi:asparagine synthase-related protein [Nocardia wallacei]|uniref:asparagine synthase-related protein n=1 Tax=Nocardia wallacei TaxID=480035 RepID=UPI002457E4CA|nr:asparagine synthase-related protein [Nocardia wallacei]